MLRITSHGRQQSSHDSGSQEPLPGKDVRDLSSSLNRPKGHLFWSPIPGEEGLPSEVLRWWQEPVIWAFAPGTGSGSVGGGAERSLALSQGQQLKCFSSLSVFLHCSANRAICCKTIISCILNQSSPCCCFSCDPPSMFIRGDQLCSSPAFRPSLLPAVLLQTPPPTGWPAGDASVGIPIHLPVETIPMPYSRFPADSI